MDTARATPTTSPADPTSPRRDAAIVGLVAQDLPALVSARPTFTEVGIWAPASLVGHCAC